jgi:hypothetical protein
MGAHRRCLVPPDATPMNANNGGGLMRGMLLVVLAMLCSACSDPNAKTCRTMEDIARNPKKVSYLKRWIGDRVGQVEFLNRFGLSGGISALEDPANFSALGLDFEFLGINQRYGFVVLHRKVEKSEPFSLETKILAVSVGDGRSAVILDLREKNDSTRALDLNSIILGLRPIGEGVFVSCR